MAIKGTDLLVVQDPADKKFYKTTLSSLSTGISAVDTTLPIKNVSQVGSTPNIAIEAATTTDSGAVARLATANDVAATNPAPSTTAVVTADLLAATNLAIQELGGSCQFTHIDGGFYAWEGEEPPTAEDECGVDTIDGGIYAA